MTISSFCSLDTQTFMKHSCAGERVLSAVLHGKSLQLLQFLQSSSTLDIFLKKTINQYRRLNSSHLKTGETTLILLILKAYRI